MSGYVTITNLKDILEKLGDVATGAERAAQIGIAQAGLAVQREAQRNASNGVRKYKKRVSARTGNPWIQTFPPKHIGATGGGPNVVTGALRRSIRTDIVRGFGNYVAVAKVGPTVEYARAVELGGKNWGGVKYPYLEPAARTLIMNGTLNRIFVSAVKREIAKGNA
jgi:hypothetical protein